MCFAALMVTRYFAALTINMASRWNVNSSVVDFFMSDPKFPTPEELQKKLTEFMKSNFGENVTLTAFTAPETAGSAPETPPDSDKPGAFDFHYLPRAIKNYLDRFVIKQDEAKKAHSI